MGELKKRKKLAVAQASEEFVAVQSMGGRMHVRWDDTASATPHGLAGVLCPVFGHGWDF
jgi:hypothetical protein